MLTANILGGETIFKEPPVAVESLFVVAATKNGQPKEMLLIKK
ncbi:hypothetical protein [Segetibacter sp.]|nr:hypothetical protein [Segetibacter sp.]